MRQQHSCIKPEPHQAILYVDRSEFYRLRNSLVSDMLDIDDFMRQSLRSAKFSIVVGGTLNEFRQSLRSAYKIA